MKTFVSMLTVAAAIAFTSPAFAGDSQAGCEAAGGVWSAETKTCTK